MSNITSATANPAVNQTQDNNRTEKKSSYGKTIGEPQLSEKAAKKRRQRKKPKKPKRSGCKRLMAMTKFKKRMTK